MAIDWDYNPFAEMERMRREMNDLFGRLGFVSRFQASFPYANMYETDEELEMIVELPGIRKEDLDIYFHENTLTLSGKRAARALGENEVMLRKERPEGEFKKTFRLPSKIAADQVQASLRDGLLTLRMPKAVEARPKQIAIQAE